jgi:predicted dehydrogenase
VAVAGARGIGRHHARWLALAGCDVVAIFGTTEATARAAAATLRDSFGFAGRPFWNWEEFLRDGGFDACHVSSPPEAHAENVHDLVAGGRHVLCEKPLTWNWNDTPARRLKRAAEMVAEADRAGVVFAMNAQYPAALPGLREFHQSLYGSPLEFPAITFTLETRGLPRSPHGAAEVWVDLGPHPLAVIDALGPGRLGQDSLACRSASREAVVGFDWIGADGRLPARLECRRVTEGEMLRRIGNGRAHFDYSAAQQDGEFVTRLSADGREWLIRDIMRCSIERFIGAVRSGDRNAVLVDGAAALRQHRALVEICARCWPETGPWTDLPAHNENG